MMSEHWSGDGWRWRLTAPASVATIDVIEPAEDHEQPTPRARRVPFGFARAAAPEAVAEPLRWDGDDS